VSHTYDYVSIYMWYQMGGGGQDDDAKDNDGDANTAWWNGIMASVNLIENEFSNFQSYFIEANGHCSFGLYYALQI